MERWYEWGMKEKSREPMLIAAISMERDGPQFVVAKGFSDQLRVGDLVRFLLPGVMGNRHQHQVWCVMQVDGHPTDPVSRVRVVEVKDW